ncbi:hypothetical protein [Bacillus sp. MUM 13]|uniref:hypothetical protein n=1 Tax=Bacillus sp. MUM 13 TaxID=1678001 RepID=UPI0008F5A721|nr:hypothetical protein [Bacillus sp. MUM 13]OIK07650.1 hypothetical protein BIV59_20850 [Bacillus sp. MUM 13]
MNIRTYYVKTAKICFRTSWISLIMAAAFFALHLFGVLTGNILEIEAPFILFSIISFAGYRVYENRAQGLPIEAVTSCKPLEEQRNLLAAFMPAPTLRVLLFEPNGALAGEIRDMNMSWYMWMIPNSVSLILPKRYGLYNSTGKLLGMYNFGWGLLNKVVMKDGEGQLIGSFKEVWKKSLFKVNGMIAGAGGEDWIPVSIGGLLNDFELITCSGKKIVRFQKGWMPIEWGERFKEMNTPVLSFSEAAEMKEKVAVLGFCAAVLHHRKN